MVVVPVTTGVIAYTEWTPTPAQTKIPATPRVVTDIEAPGAETRVIVIGRYPGPVVPAGTVENGVVVDVTTGITGCVTYIDHVWGAVIDMHILGVINR
jgi:hypothetical protein